MGLAKLFEKWPQRPFTVLGVGPMSPAVVDASLESATEHGAPMVFIPSRNQVESTTAAGGYVEGWDSRAFRRYVDERVGDHRHTGPVFIGRDHGGPWQRDEEYAARVGWDEALASALLSYRRDIEAGFDYLHIDTARDPHLAGPVPLDLAAERAVTLLAKVEAYRRGAGYSELDYEVSLEQANGGISDLHDFAYFLSTLVERIDRQGLPRPLFVVGNTGTLTKAGANLGSVDFDVTAQLARLAERHRLVLKEHNADYLSDEVLARHPEARIGMANVAPEFGTLETGARLRLATLEEAACRRRGLEPSGFTQVLTDRVLRSQRWRKWLPAGADADAWLRDPERRDTLVACNGHYLFSDEAVRAATARLFRSCHELGVCLDPRGFVRGVLERGVRRYLFAFGLAGTSGELSALATGTGSLVKATA